MVSIRISGRITAYTREGRRITEPETLLALAGPLDEGRLTDRFGGTPGEDSIAGLLAPGGRMILEYREETGQSWVVAEYSALRRLDDSELGVLVDYTIGRWIERDGEGVRVGEYLIDLYPTDLRDYDPETPLVEQQAV